MLLSHYQTKLTEAGLDEAGRGCYAGPVFAAAVILPADFFHPLLNDSKQLKEKERDVLRPVIEKESIAFAVASVDNNEIDKINILQASFKAMHLCLDNLTTVPGFLLIDGNRFKPYKKIHHQCIVKGDGKYASIAAASNLCKKPTPHFLFMGGIKIKATVQRYTARLLMKMGYVHCTVKVLIYYPLQKNGQHCYKQLR
jgi:ribonuclease HII